MHPHGVKPPWCTKRRSAERKGILLGYGRTGSLRRQQWDEGSDGAAGVLATAKWKKASLPSDLFIDFGVWGPLMDE